MYMQHLAYCLAQGRVQEIILTIAAQDLTAINCQRHDLSPKPVALQLHLCWAWGCGNE